MTRHPLRLLAAKRLLTTLLLAMFLVGCAYKNHIKRGDAFFDQGSYEAALNEYEAALARKPDSADAQLRVSDAKNALVSQYTAEARELLRAGEFEGAVQATLRLQNRLPDTPPVEQLARDVSSRIQLEAARAAEARAWARSLDLLFLIYDAFPPARAQLEPEIGRVKLVWTQSLSQRAQQAEQAGRVGDALLLHAQATVLLMRPENAAKRDELHARLRAEHVYVMRLNGRGSDAARTLGSLTQLNSPKNMRLVTNPKASAFHAELTLELGRTMFSTQRTTATQRVTYTSGTRQVENPQYDPRRRDLERAERELNRDEGYVNQAQRDVNHYEQQVSREGDTPGVSTGAKQNLSRARSDLDRALNNADRARDAVDRARRYLYDTPQFIEEDVYSDLDYPVTTHTLTGLLPVSLRVTHQDGRNELVESWSATISAQDSEHAGYSFANVMADPLNLPSEASLAPSLYQLALDASFAMADESFQGWRQLMLERALDAPSVDDRINTYIIYLITDPTAVRQHVVDEIAAARGIPDPVGLLSTPQ